MLAKNVQTLRSFRQLASSLTTIAGKPVSLPQGECGQAKSQVGFKAASAAVAVVAPREAEWRFCAVGNPAWMPG